MEFKEQPYFILKGPHNMLSDGTVRTTLLCIETVVKGVQFETWRKQFVNKHAHNFGICMLLTKPKQELILYSHRTHLDYAEENKLIYTEIHNEYENHIEKIIADNLPSSVDLGSFMSCLPNFLEGPGGKDEAIGKAVTLLLEVSDFEQFKQMMMYRKKEIEEADSKGIDVLSPATNKGEGIF